MASFTGTFLLNGHALGRHYGAFVPAAFEVGHLLSPQKNVLTVTIHPPPPALIDPLYNSTEASDDVIEHGAVRVMCTPSFN